MTRIHTNLTRWYAPGWSVTFLLVMVLFGCSTGVEPSEEFGVLRVTVQSAPGDTAVSIIGEEIAVDTSAAFNLTFGQGKAFCNGNYAVLFQDTLSYRQEEINVNVLEREGHAYQPHIVFESFVPPGTYDSLEFTISAQRVRISGFTIPVSRPPGMSLLETIPHEFAVEDNRTTEIVVQISPFQSVQRFRDRYQFIPVLSVLEHRLLQ